MLNLRNVVLGGLGAAAVFLALPAQAQTVFTGAGEESELDCDGGAVSVEGASNTLTITGDCTRLTVSGASNRITVELAAASSIRVEGAGNQIRWRAPGTAKPRTSIVGAGNRISQLR
ncbi:DUF3060 domain-containing protein [Sphingomonas sp. HF-S3]|jgi:hypothetical protein|uniref:DUF3060 domain-containing protein n=1 Tax=Sphingomonas rustica TaxID=3103142 RepID=A0ABV0B9N0_9SPHN